ncbi:MAG: NAD(P)/FAD-dependent oxidoreductase [Gammaproteobacteria bacterium]
MTPSTSIDTPHYDAIVIGAGMAGMYFHFRLHNMGMSVRGFEAGSDIGGTWYWNRYPGARFDSESYSYGYSFSQEILDEWEWSEHFAPQPETLRYLNFIADKFDLRRDIKFNTRVVSALYDPDNRTWTVDTEDGERTSARYLLHATGVLSAPFIPEFDGVDSFAGRTWHTSDWPREPIDLGNKRVGVIGTGATAVQMITEIAKDVGDLTVFQRTPNYCKPLHNRPITPDEQRDIKARYPEIFKRCNETLGAFLHGFDERSAFDVSDEERDAIYEELWNGPGFSYYLACFKDVLTDEKANETAAEFARKKIRERVKDPDVAELLAPKDHAFGTKRQPMESGYYEVYDQPNVHLVDLKTTPIERFTKTGIETTSKRYDFDIVIFATGFDAVTGALNRIDILGEDGASLKDKWDECPAAYLGIISTGFPNMFIAGGPHNTTSFCNIPRCIEHNVEWITDCIRYMEGQGYTRIVASQDAEDAWTDHVLSTADETLFTQTDSWFMGANIPGKKRVFLNYFGGIPYFREKIAEVAANGYEGFVLD